LVKNCHDPVSDAPQSATRHRRAGYFTGLHAIAHAIAQS
jgi:hypothetical protein